MRKTRKTRTRRWLLRVLVIGAVLVSMLPLGSGVANAATCGSSSGHTLCVTAPVSPLVGPATITITNSPNSGVVIATWIPSGGPNITLIQEFGPSPGTNNYSFTWPTQKYLDASGVLRLQASATNTTPVDVPVALHNGNVTDFQHSPSNWESFLPNPAWTGATDPVIVAVGDGASDQAAGNNLAHSIALADPEVLLYLGDIYETGTFTENLNHYGQNSMDGGPGTLWGAMGTFTQPTMGDHEAVNSVAWQDYFHGRPLYTSFEFANVLFVNLASTGVAFGKNSAQYNYVNSVLTSTNNPPPPCIITYFQNPVIAKDKVVAKRVPMWSLITNNGGDLLFAGDNHTMIQYKPLNDQVELPSPGQPTMVEMISGAGGHSAGPTFTGDPRIDWSQGQTPGAVYVTLNGAAAGGVPTSLSWAYKDTNGNVLKSGTRNCGAGPAPPSITDFSPTSGPVGTSVTINGSGFTGTTEVRFNGTSVGSGNFTVVSGGQITATVPSGAGTGPISLTAPGGTATSSTNFTVTATTTLSFGPDADTFVRSDSPTAHPGSKVSFSVDGSPTQYGLLKFTVSGVPSGTIPTVKLRLYCLDASPKGGDFFRVANNSWQENTVTWNTQPLADPTSIASLGAVIASTWYEVDLSSLVTGNGTYSIRIASTSANAVDYSTKEGAAGFAPQLVVTFT